MVSKKKLTVLAAISLILIAGFSIWILEKPNRNAWNYSVATSISNYYKETGSLPYRHEVLIKSVGDAGVARGFRVALEKMNFRNISETDFFSGEDLIELPDKPKDQKHINNFIRNACAGETKR